MGHIAGLLLSMRIRESNSAAWWGCTTAQPDPTNRSDFCVDRDGIEPPTRGSSVPCSTTELPIRFMSAVSGGVDPHTIAYVRLVFKTSFGAGQIHSP